MDAISSPTTLIHMCFLSCTDVYYPEHIINKEVVQIAKRRSDLGRTSDHQPFNNSANFFSNFSSFGAMTIWQYGASLCVS